MMTVRRCIGRGVWGQVGVAEKARSRRRRERKYNLWGQFENIKVKLFVTGEDFDLSKKRAYFHKIYFECSHL